jgi:hypothetical protein
LNRLRPPRRQTNKKIALDEGTCDVLAAILLGRPDIYGWHRSGIEGWDPRRRALDVGRTMAHFRGGRADPHADGNVWASACWTARERVAAAGHDRARFDRMLVRGLELSATDLDLDQPQREHLDQHADTHPHFNRDRQSNPADRIGPNPQSPPEFSDGVDVGVLRRRRHVSGLLAAMVAVDPGLAGPVLAGMAVHGIRLGASNARLREDARAAVGGVVVGGG